MFIHAFQRRPLQVWMVIVKIYTVSLISVQSATGSLRVPDLLAQESETLCTTVVLIASLPLLKVVHQFWVKRAQELFRIQYIAATKILSIYYA